MNTPFTHRNLLIMALTLVSTIGPALAQSKRPMPSAKSPVAAPRPASARTTSQSMATANPADRQTPAQLGASPMSASSERPAPSAPNTTAPVRTTPAQPAKSMATVKHKYLNVGIGLGAYYGGGLPLGVSFEVDTKNNISVGGSVDYFRYNPGGYGYTFLYAGGRASYHLGELLDVSTNKFDPYVGATLGLRYAGYHNSYGYDNYVSPYNSGLFLGIHLGSRYMFSEKVGGFAEVGYGVSALRLGVAAKF